MSGRRWLHTQTNTHSHEHHSIFKLNTVYFCEFQCSSSCGRGTQWRKVYCRQRLATGSYRHLQDEECEGVKPDTHRPCVNTQCLKPHLVGGEWSKVGVSLLLWLVLVLVFWLVLSWVCLWLVLFISAGNYFHCVCFQCSVTCGKGIQHREPVCRRQTASGQLVTLDRSVCIGLQPPPLIRSCRMSPCNSEAPFFLFLFFFSVNSFGKFAS